ncbi:MAG: phosphopantetheine-binding protein [Corynebacterium sp.]|nr:phosphopantetheine-binding protein [Corynebacterium sp.]
MEASELYKILATSAHIPADEIDEKIQPEKSLREDLGLDSLDYIALCVRIDEACGRHITEAEAAELKTVGDLEKLLSEKA